MNGSAPSPSPELLKANQRLYKLRQQQSHKAALGQSERKRPSPNIPPWEDAEPTSVALTTADTVTQLPTHLGWGSAAATRAIRAASRRCTRAVTQVERLTADHLSCHPISNGSHQQGQPSDSQPQSAASHQLRFPLDGDIIKHYPTIGIAALTVELAAVYRVWLLCRYLDGQGRGWLLAQCVREQLTDNDSQLRLFGWRRLRQILGRGHGWFWEWDKTNGRLWLYGAARVAGNLELSRLVGKPVSLPIKSITDGISVFKAHLYGSWHSGRKTANPISREVQATITGIPERTQRHYGKVARIGRRTNIAIGSKYTNEEAKKQAWQRGRAVFQFTDHQGRQGRKGISYVAWHLPNSYIGPHQQTTKGRLRKINRKLQDLVTKGARGNSGRMVEKKYYANGKDAGRAMNRGKGSEVYWPMTAESRQSYLWTVFSLG